MSKEDIHRVMDFLLRTSERHLRLLGGEPTLHPHFVEIVEEAMVRGFHVHVFTNGIMPRETADFLGELPLDRLSVLCNVSPQTRDSDRLGQKRLYALERLGKRVQLGITLTSPHFDFEFLIDLIRQMKLRKRIRLGVAQPIVGKDNVFLKPSQYPEIGRSIVRMARACIQEDILIGFDCGLTLCMFSPDEIGALAACSEGFVRLCKPIVDIGPGLQVWHCFPLSEVYNTTLERFQTRNDIVHFYEKLVAPYRSLGCMPECMRCDYLRRGQCKGGCLAHVMNSLNRLPPRFASGDDQPTRTQG